MSHKIVNDDVFFCPKCFRHRPIALRSNRVAGKLFACTECKTAVEALLKKRAKEKK